MRASLVNYVLYQVGWCACVFGAGLGHAAAGAVIALLALLAHVLMAERRWDEARLALFAAMLGIAVDALQIRLGTLHFPSASAHPSWPPVWMPLLWAQFATTLRFSMAWLRGSMWRGVLFGAIGGPIAFLAGARVGAVHFGDPMWVCVALLAALWSVAVPAVAVLAGHQHGHAGPGAYRWERKTAH